MLFINPVFEEVWGIPRSEIYANPRVFVDAVVPEDRERVLAALRAQDEAQIPFDLDYRIRNAAGEVRSIRARTFFVYRGGKVHRVVGIAWDRTAQRQAEDELRLLQKGLEQQIEARTAELQRLLAEKDLLMKELHHRVKNNLQLVSSLLQLQAQRTAEPEVKAELSQSWARVHTIALAHQHLYGAGKATLVDLERYVSVIAKDVAQAIGSREVTLSTCFDVGGIELPVDRAVPLGLLLNELLTNAYRHAFPGGASGMLRVSLSRTPDDHVLLEVADDGVGFEPHEHELSETLGFRLLHALVGQLDASLEIESSRGTTVRISIPMPSRA
jgi:two-component sensor histidine kinase